MVAKSNNHTVPYCTILYYRVPTGPYGTIQDHVGKYRTIRGHMVPYGAIQNHMGPYRTIWDHTGLYVTILDLKMPYSTNRIIITMVSC